MARLAEREMRRTSFTSRSKAGWLVAGTVALSACNSRFEEAKKKHAEVALQTIRMSAELTYMKTGRYPTSLSDVDVQRREDPWGRPFNYAVKSSGQRLEISSSGPDGIAGNTDDIWAVD